MRLKRRLGRLAAEDKNFYLFSSRGRIWLANEIAGNLSLQLKPWKCPIWRAADVNQLQLNTMAQFWQQMSDLTDLMIPSLILTCPFLVTDWVTDCHSRILEERAILNSTLILTLTKKSVQNCYVRVSTEPEFQNWYSGKRNAWRKFRNWTLHSALITWFICY